jgi:hypothetical protein
MQAALMASKVETADFDRDPNQGSMAIDDLTKSKKAPPGEKEKRFLLGELK